MTLLGYTDGADAASGASYLELAEWITHNCYDVDRNLAELFRRAGRHSGELTPRRDTPPHTLPFRCFQSSFRTGR